MNKLFVKINKENLTLEEKSEILSNLKNYISENPVQQIKSTFYTSWFVPNSKSVVSFILIIVLIVTTSTAFASGSSLPGDILYPIKLWSEDIQSFVSVGTKAQAKVLVKHAITRLKEVEQLVNTGKLDAKTRKVVEDKFIVQTNEALKSINDLKNNGNSNEASTINSDFKISLSEHEKTITELSDDDKQKNTKEELVNIISNVQGQIKKTTIINDEIDKSFQNGNESKNSFKNNENTASSTQKDNNPTLYNKINNEFNNNISSSTDSNKNNSDYKEKIDQTPSGTTTLQKEERKSDSNDEGKESK